MTTLNCTAKVEEDGSLTIPGETLRILGVKPGDRLDVIVEPLPQPQETTNREGPKPQSLADLFNGLVGGFRSGQGAERLSENTGEKFTDSLVEKHEQGHL